MIDCLNFDDPAKLKLPLGYPRLIFVFLQASISDETLELSLHLEIWNSVIFSNKFSVSLYAGNEQNRM